jgi:hypothetical protein
MNNCDTASSSLRLRVPLVIFSAFILIIIALMCCTTLAQGESPNLIGTWKVEITFANEDHRSVQFDARGEGKGTLTVTSPQARAWGSDKSSEAKWTQGEGKSVTFSGQVEFPIGNVGRDPGTLVCKGKFESESVITGEVEFSPLVGERPSKLGTFKALRTGG